MAKKKTPDGEKCERTLPFKLSDEEKARKAEIAANLNKKLEAANEAKKVEMAKHNGTIKDLTKKISDALRTINEGVERRAVTCVEVKNYDKNRVEWWFEGLALEDREMRPEDRQQSLNEQKKGKDMRPKALKEGK